MSGVLCRLRTRVGWRGFFLLCFGLFDLVYGWTKLIYPDPVSKASQQMELIGQLFPVFDPETTLNLWGYLWWLAGILCIIAAFMTDDWLGYGAAIAIKVSWILANLWAWGQGLVGGGSVVATWVFILAVATGLALREETVRGLEELATGEIPRPKEDPCDADPTDD